MALTYNKIRFYLPRLLCIGLLLVLSACSDGLSQLERIQSRGELRVALIATPPLYFPDESLIKGYDYDIVSNYASSIGVKLEIIRTDTIGDVTTLLKQGKAHIGIAGNSPSTPDERIADSIPYDHDEWLIIGNRSNRLPESIDEMIPPSTVVVAKGSKPALVMTELKKQNPQLYWLELPNANNRQVLEQVNKNNFKLTVINAKVYKYYRYIYPEIKVAFTLENQYPSVWLTHKNDDVSILTSINEFISRYKKSGKLEKSYNSYFRHLNVFNYTDSVHYLRLIKTKLPLYWPYFKRAAVDNQFDERFLAAVSYQESHWNKKARSHTGVRGLMMLTKDTAKRVGVRNRLDPEQSIMGGAKYLNILKESLSDNIKEPDRFWMTLASYNIGLGHLEDARILTQKQGDDPNLWIDVEKHLPKLSEKKWHKKTKYGYARGHEPVEFVRRVRRYYDILRLYQQEEILEKLDQPLDLKNLKITSPTL